MTGIWERAGEAANAGCPRFLGRESGMIIEPRKVILKDGRECVLRSPRPEDAQELLKLTVRASGETDFLSCYPEERLADVNQERDFILRIAGDDADAMVCAVVEGRIAGNAGINRLSPRIKCRHRAVLGITVLKEYWGLGIGSVLLREAEAAAKAAGFERLELEVVEENVRAAALYEKAGFDVCGRWPGAFRYKDGSCSDLVLMTKKVTCRPR